MSDGPKITLDRETFKVLASDTRLDILKALDVRQKTVTELARELDLNKATVFEHLEKLQGADLVQKLEDDRKWVYYQLTWKARRLLHPEAITIALLLSTSLAAVVTAVVSFWLWWKGHLVDTFQPSGRSEGLAAPTSAGAQDTANGPSSAATREMADGGFALVQDLVRDGTLLWIGVALAALAVLLVAAALLVRQRARAQPA